MDFYTMEYDLLLYLRDDMLTYSDPGSEISFYTMLAGPEVEAKRLALANDIDSDIAKVESLYVLYRIDKDNEKLQALKSFLFKLSVKYMSKNATRECDKIATFIG